MIKIAIAGTSGLAQYIAHYLSTQTYHQFFFLSRNPNPGLIAKDWQVLPVDYSNLNDVRYKLVGVDTVISTVSGQAQLSLIEAAAQVHVRRFVPSEFEGKPAARPQAGILDRGKSSALSRLYQLRNSGMEYTVFACGIFYERFGPGGMAALQLGHGTSIAGEGDYLMDIRHRSAQIPCRDASGQEVYICMTSAEDVARFVVAALDLPEWPSEFRMFGERMTAGDVVKTVEIMCGAPFHRTIHTPETLQTSLSYAVATGNVPQQWRLHHLIATSAGCYDFDDANLNELVNVQPKRFAEWLYAAWS
ncbi:hypothetical protein VTN77DRAFT_7247 [Rasamsonia byssochlamydoides]|uniref:uncharacterized protein n=1 Tax=Rasamsonia byssochlamydoides TaxID=89139 RepID=UPI003741FA67